MLSQMAVLARVLTRRSVFVLLALAIAVSGCKDQLTGIDHEKNALYDRGGVPGSGKYRKQKGTGTDSTAAVASVVIAPSSVTLAVGVTQQLSVKLYSASGTALTGRSVSWVSSNGLVAKVSSAGLVTALAAGSATIKATSEQVSGTSAITVTPAGPSTWISPGEDIQAKVNANGAGTAFLLKAGIHRQQQVTPKGGMSFVGEAGAVMNGAKLLTGWVAGGPGWYVAGQTQTTPSATSSRCEADSPRCDYQHDLYINNVLQKHAGSLAGVGVGKWFFDYDRDRIYVGSDPSGKIVEVTDKSYAFSGSASVVTIKGLTIEKYANRAQNGAIHGPGTSGWIVENNVVQLNHGTGIRIGNRMQVLGNKVVRNGQIGIGGIGTDALVETNEIAYNNTLGYRSGWEAGGTKFVRTNRLIVRGNHAHHNNGPGLWTDIDNYTTLYENNRSEYNTIGIFHEISFDAIIRNNTLRENGHSCTAPEFYGCGAIRIASSPNVQIYGNLVENNANGIGGLQQDRGTGPDGKVRYVKNLKVHDNIIKQDSRGKAAAGISRDFGGTEVFTSWGNVWSKNTYYVPSRSGSYWAWDNGLRSRSYWQERNQDVDGLWWY